MITYFINNITESELLNYLQDANDTFPIPLNQIVDLKEYSKKLYKYGTIFSSYNNNILIGIAVCYFNNEKTKEGYLSILHVKPDFQDKGIAKGLIYNFKTYAIMHSFRYIKLEVYIFHKKAISLYEKMGFKIIDVDSNNKSLYMRCNIL